ESLRNAFRHAQALRIEVEFWYDTQRFSDARPGNGRGIDPEIPGAGVPAWRSAIERNSSGNLQPEARPMDGCTLALWGVIEDHRLSIRQRLRERQAVVPQEHILDRLAGRGNPPARPPPRRIMQNHFTHLLERGFRTGAEPRAYGLGLVSIHPRQNHS